MRGQFGDDGFSEMQRHGDDHDIRPGGYFRTGGSQSRFADEDFQPLVGKKPPEPLAHLPLAADNANHRLHTHAF